MKRGLQLKLMLKEYNLHMEFDNMSYQQLLNSVDQEIGLQIELNWRKKTFEHMMNWDYNNTNIMELSYENIFGNEVETFKELFKHYGFNNEIAEIGLKYVRIYSFENQKISGKTGEDTHLTKGHKGQWKEYFSDDLKRIFKERHQDLLMKLNYEQHGDW